MAGLQDPLLQPQSLTAGELLLGSQRAEISGPESLPVKPGGDCFCHFGVVCEKAGGTFFGYEGLPGGPALRPSPWEIRR